MDRYHRKGVIKMKKSIAFLLALSLVLALASCAAGTGVGNEKAEVPAVTDNEKASEDSQTPSGNQEGSAVSDGEAEETPVPLPAEPAAGGVKLLTEGISSSTVTPAWGMPLTPIYAFSKGLMDSAEGENPVISPVSAYFALAMAANGADGVTLNELTQLLVGNETIHKAGGAADEINNAALLMAQALASSDDSCLFTAANSAWVDGDAAILEDYLQKLVTYYNADVYAAELETEEAVDAMNSWISQKTNGLIPSLFGEPLDKDAMMVLINTLYMKAKWQMPFSKDNTWEDVFHAESGDVRTDFMHMTKSLHYLAGDGYEGVELPYRGNSMRFIALKPTSGTVRELLAALDLSDFSGYDDGTGNVKVRLSLPKFEVECFSDMTDTLKDIGIPSAFDENAADFSNMGTSQNGDPLYISQVIQKAKVIVDEEGTEAAAATAVITTEATAFMPEPDPIELKFDEPFLYMILDTEYGVPVFMGIMESPT